MRQFFGIIFVILFIVSAGAALLLLNIRTGILHPDKVKSIVSESSAYEIVAGSLRESLVGEDSAEIDSGPLLEIITEAINAETLRQVAEKAIDDSFAAIEDPISHSQIVIPTSQIGRRLEEVTKTKLNLDETPDLDSINGSNDLNSLIFKDKVYDLSDNPIIFMLSKLKLVLIGLSGLSALSALLLFLIPSKSASSRFKWLGSGVLLLGLLFGGLTAALIYVVPGLIDQSVAMLDLTDQKLLLGVNKIISLLTGNQQFYLTVETIAGLVLGIILIAIGRSVREEQINLLKDEIEIPGK